MVFIGVRPEGIPDGYRCWTVPGAAAPSFGDVGRTAAETNDRGADPVAENTESTPEETAMNADAVLSLQETQSEEDEVQAHWSSLSIFTGNCGSAQ
jgi:hypothetical protein